MEIFLVRHGQTPGNLEKRYVGSSDQPLSEKGIETAFAARGKIGARLVYVSPMKRARQTAEIMFPDAEQIVFDDLREMDFGDFENKNADELSDNEEYTAWVDSGCETTCPNGEDVESFSERVCGAFEQILQDAERRGAESVVIVSHGGSMMAIMGKYSKPNRRYYEWLTENCRCWHSELIYENEIPVLTNYSLI